jgi:hypothetical protein
MPFHSILVATVGGNHSNDNRLWILIAQTGTLNYTLDPSSESGYDYGLLWKGSTPPFQHFYQQSRPNGWIEIRQGSGESALSGSISVVSGEYLVLIYWKDGGDDGGTDNVTLTAHIV